MSARWGISTEVKQVQAKITCKNREAAWSSNKDVAQGTGHTLTKLPNGYIKKKNESTYDTSHVSKSFNGKSAEIFSYVCLAASIKLGVKTFKIQPFLYSAAQISYISHLLPQLHQYIWGFISQLSYSLCFNGHFKYFSLFVLFLLSSLFCTHYKSSSEHHFWAPQNTALGSPALLLLSLFPLLKRTIRLLRTESSFSTVAFIFSPMTWSVFVTALNSPLLEDSHRKLTLSVLQPRPRSLFVLFQAFEMPADWVFQSKESINWCQQFLGSSLMRLYGVTYANHTPPPPKSKWFEGISPWEICRDCVKLEFSIFQ